MTYIGRFAPSPTGLLHFGSLVAAVASYCDAKANHGQWLLRIEDLDRPREVAGAVDTILRQLEALGFEWDGKVHYQSQRDTYYAAALYQLQKQDLIYPCTCTRKEIADSTHLVGVEGLIYPKTCLQHPIKLNTKAALRIKAKLGHMHFNDAIQGVITQNLQLEAGDFVLQRADGLFTYQLAVVVDDAMQGVTHVVRGADLLHSTPRQIYLQQQLGLPTPSYAHIPTACNQFGEKLSKQTLAKPIDTRLAGQALCNALHFLGQKLPSGLANEPTHTVWQWAIAHWQLSQISKLSRVIEHTESAR